MNDDNTSIYDKYLPDGEEDIIRSGWSKEPDTNIFTEDTGIF